MLKENVEQAFSCSMNLLFRALRTEFVAQYICIERLWPCEIRLVLRLKVSRKLNTCLDRTCNSSEYCERVPSNVKILCLILPE